MQCVKMEAAIQQLWRPATTEMNGNSCLLYTSDAADEEDSGDIGGRGILKKKTKET